MNKNPINEKIAAENKVDDDESSVTDYQSDHSEFGEANSTNKMYDRLPEIKNNIAKLLKLEVSCLLVALSLQKNFFFFFKLEFRNFKK